jgi:hypothetical protein
LEDLGAASFEDCEPIFNAMRFDTAFPVDGWSEFIAPGNKWTGERGEKRRAFCTKMADFLESNP